MLIGILGEDRERRSAENISAWMLNRKMGQMARSRQTACTKCTVKVKTSVPCKVWVWLRKTLAIFVSVLVLWTLYSVTAHHHIILSSRRNVAGGGRWGSRRGNQGQCSRCSVIWERVNFRSAKSGHKATAAKPQRPTESFSGSIALPASNLRKRAFHGGSFFLGKKVPN